MINLIKLFALMATLLSAFITLAQDGIGIGTQNVSSDAVLEVKSTDKGVLLPRLTTSDRTSMTPSSGGLMVYDTEFQAFFYYDTVSVSWKRMVEENSFGTVPLGGIMMWSGSSNDIPDGYALCDGQTVNSFKTPDLSERFVMGGSTPGNLDMRVVVTDTLNSNYQVGGAECSEHEFLWSGTITIAEPPGGFPPPPAPGEPLLICTGMEDNVGMSFTYSLPMDSCDHILNDVLLITDVVVRRAVIACDAYELTNCTSTPNPNYYLNNEACRLAAELYTIAFIMRVE